MTKKQSLHSRNTSTQNKSARAGVVFFDGVCGLCNRVVDFLIKKDHNDFFRYAPLQGETAKELLSQSVLTNIDTIIYLEGNRIYEKSDAAILILFRLGGFWKTAAALKIIPRFIRDSVYDYIAKKRYGWFGKRESCRMPTAEDREKILP